MAAATQRQTIVAAFPDRAQAQAAIRELKQMGFRDDQIGVTSRERADTADYTDDGDEVNTSPPRSSAGGLAAGAGIGRWGAGDHFRRNAGHRPALRRALAAISRAQRRAAAVAGLAGTLIGMGIPRDEAEYYESEFQAGRTIVTVMHNGRYADVLAVLRRHGGYERSGATAVPASATAGKQPMHAQPSHSALQSSSESCPPSATSASRTAQPAARGEKTIQAREEELHVDKQRQQTGEVRVRKEVRTEHKTIDVPVSAKR